MSDFACPTRYRARELRASAIPFVLEFSWSIEAEARLGGFGLLLRIKLDRFLWRHSDKEHGRDRGNEAVHDCMMAADQMLDHFGGQFLFLAQRNGR